jgi:hypothetical protein
MGKRSEEQHKITKLPTKMQKYFAHTENSFHPYFIDDDISTLMDYFVLCRYACPDSFVCHM